ncbi:enoyl-[acyl-carrier-protein] reductase [NADH] [Nocardiopsis sp. Huas11]|uniref:enoyl-ACP reductase FabI n=1 Tax=Nocardiopsis sp. Huas11 TaxID=2183912 RepID=UPI000EADD076|nr:enoyl-ACP reductase FabI [Nocardiopsis sp. Huas11]RKS06570.1 enoyl-[acyl-carrier-protein] reductase [NADH] [Nocardiopsis sp. Huas11]
MNLLITGITTQSSIAYAIAEEAMNQGHEVVVTNPPGRQFSICERIAKRLPKEPVAVLPMDVTDPEQIAATVAAVGEHWDHVDGVLHAIAFAPEKALGGNFLDTEWADVATAVHVSGFSLKALTVGFRDLLGAAPHGAGVVSLTFDASVAWPVYDWMGSAKAVLENSTKYLARDLGAEGIRVNAIAAGPIKSLAGGSIPGFAQISDSWGDHAPLGWDTKDATVVAGPALFLMSPAARAITGTVLHVDGGYHAMGAPLV